MGFTRTWQNFKFQLQIYGKWKKLTFQQIIWCPWRNGPARPWRSSTAFLIQVVIKYELATSTWYGHWFLQNCLLKNWADHVKLLKKETLIQTDFSHFSLHFCVKLSKQWLIQKSECYTWKYVTRAFESTIWSKTLIFVE